MSHTDKDRPFWVAALQDHTRIKHDHADGVCVISDDRRDRWPAFGSHHRARNCNKRVVVHYTCTKDDPHTTGPFRYGSQTCWTTICACPIPEAWRSDPHACTDRVRVQCIGHTRTEFDPSRPCVCDEAEPAPTCFPEPPLDHRGWFRGGPPADYRRSIYHAPERRRERDDLSRIAREYNAGNSVDDEDFVNRQARNSALWNWW